MKAHLLLILLILLVSCNKTEKISQTAEEYQGEIKEKIDQFDKVFYEAWENEDLETCLSSIDEGLINMFSFGMSMTKEECREGFADVFDTYSIEDVEYEIVELIADQNYAVQTLLFKQKWITNDKQDTILFDMRGIVVFKKQIDGSWKMFRNFGQHKNDLNI